MSGGALATGLEDTVLLAALIALYLAMSTFEGSLIGDMRLLALLTAASCVFAVLPLYLSVQAPLLAAVVVLAGVFVAGVMPRFWQRSLLFGRALGFVVVYVYGFRHLGTSTSTEIVATLALALGVVTATRLVAGMADPAGVTRRRLARLLLDSDPESTNRAVFAWLTEAPQTWQAGVVRGAVLVRGARASLQDDPEDSPSRSATRSAFLDSTASTAQLVAVTVRARATNRSPDLAAQHLVSLRKLSGSLDGHERLLGERIVRGLTVANAAALERDHTPLAGAGRVDPGFLRTVLRGGLTGESEWLRHGVRTVVVVGLVLAAVSWRDPGPFVVALLTGTYGVLYPSWTGSLRQVWRNVTGIVAGAALAAVISLLASPASAVIISWAFLAVGLTYIATNLTILYCCLVIALSEVVAPAVDLSPVNYAMHYLAYTTAGALLGTLVAFLLVPTLSMRTRWRRIDRARHATSVVLTTLADKPRPDIHTSTTVFQQAVRAQQDSMPAQNAASRVDVLEPVADAAAALESLNLLCLGLAFEPTAPNAWVVARLQAAAAALATDDPATSVVAEAATPRDDDDPFIEMVMVETARLLDILRSHRVAVRPTS